MAKPHGGASVISRFRDAILAEWRRRDPRGEPSERTAELLDAVAEELGDTPSSHVVERAAARLDISALVRELSTLRSCTLAVWDREESQHDADELRALEAAFDRAIAESVDRYVGARDVEVDALEALLAGAPAGLAFVDRELRYVRINDALAAMNGRPAAEHLGRKVSEVLPDVADRLVPLLERVLATGEPVANVLITLPHGQSLLGHFFPVRDASANVHGVGAIVFDVTERRQAEEALRVEQTRLRAILEFTPAAIWIKDAEGRIILANRRLASALGCTYEELIGRRSEDVLPPEMAEQHQAHDAAVLAENRAMEVEELVPAPEGVRTFLSIKFPIPTNPPLVGGIATEITERKRMEERLREAVRAREDILAVVSHDLRNPLNTIRLSVSTLLAQMASDPRARRPLDMIHRASTRMETLIEDLLDMANIHAGHLKLETKREPADAILREALEHQQTLAAEKGIELRHTGDLDGVDIVCDRDRILQVFANLVGNALKFCRAGDTITLCGERAGAYVQFSVIDTGPGIAPEALPHLFDAYWSGEHGRRGVGLGLYICRGIVEGHRGRIGVESTPGAGAKFSFTLPIAHFSSA